jgi:hypothetical protein
MPDKVFSIQKNGILKVQSYPRHTHRQLNEKTKMIQDKKEKNSAKLQIS